jgi:N-methylhydantoinase A
MQLPDFSQDYVRTYTKRLGNADVAAISALYEEMETQGRRILLKSGAREDQIRFARSADLRYVGQFNEVEVACPDGPVTPGLLDALAAAFHDRHEQTFAFAMPNRPIEVVYLRVRAIAATAPVHLRQIPAGAEEAEAARKADRRCYFGRAPGWQMTPIYDGAALASGNRIAGPALIEETSSTILVPAGGHARVDQFGNYLIQA